MPAAHGRSWRPGLVQALAWTVLLFLLLPCFVTLPVSLTDTDYLALPEHGLSLRHWRNLATSPEWIAGFAQSLGIAVCATALAVVSGTLCAIGCRRLPAPWGTAVRVVALMPMIVPTIVYALGLYRVYARVGLLDTLTGVVLAHAAIGLPYVVITAGAALVNLDPRLEQAARNLGASPSQTLWHVILPNIRLGIMAGAVFAFVTSWDELVIVLFVAGRRVHTLPREIWSGVRESLDPTIAAVATLLIAVTLLALVPTLRRGYRLAAGRA